MGSSLGKQLMVFIFLYFLGLWWVLEVPIGARGGPGEMEGSWEGLGKVLGASWGSLKDPQEFNF